VAAPGYGATDLRRYLGLGMNEGVFAVGDLKVTQRAAGPGMAVDVAAGDVLVEGDFVTRQGLYHQPVEAALTGGTEITIPAAHGTLARLDQVILEIKDTQFDGSGLNRGQVRLLQGSASAGANRSNRLGAAALPSSAILLADVEVAPLAGSIANANIADKRPLAIHKHDVGDVIFNAGAALKPGCSLADGGLLNRTQFALLFAQAGTAHSSGDGSTTFGKPDLLGRSPVGAGTGSGLTAKTLGNRYGQETVTLVTSQIPAHSHPMRATESLSDGVAAHGDGNAGYVRKGGASPTSSETENAGSGSSHTNLVPSTVLGPQVYTGMAGAT
jgi:microcystin-dependent protein